MTRTRPVRLLAGLVALGLVAAACGDDDEDTGDGAEETTADTTADTEGESTETTAGGSDTTAAGGEEGAAVDLSADCPSPLVIQTDWFPEAEHGALYEMVGEGYTVDVGNKVVRGPLVAGGQETGIEIEVRTGGPAIGFAEPRVQMYSDDSIHLGYSSTDAQALSWEEAPLISVIAPLEINPQIIMWDADTYPDIETIADLGEAGVTVNVFAGGGFAEVFVAQGIWSADQVDPSYDGSPARFIAEGDIAQQGFASAEPYNYEFVFEEYGKAPAYQLLHDAGYEVYSQTLAVKPDDLETLRPCLEKFVPIVQQAAVDFVNAPDRANAIIIDAVDQYDDFWVYDQGLADYSVETQLELGLVGNGPDATIGNMEEGRIQGVLDAIREANMNIPDDLTAADMFTNEFIDDSIGL
jgi:hypothetical protein